MKGGSEMMMAFKWRTKTLSNWTSLQDGTIFFFFGKIRWYSYSLSWRFFVLDPNMLPIPEPSLDKLILWRKQERREKKMYFCAGVTFSTHFLIDYMISSSQWLIIKGDTECIRRKIKNRKVRYRQVYYSNQKYFD